MRRVLSVDLLRGFDVLLMLFVNEIAGVPGAPALLLHVKATDDGMTITDVVFPAFLFIIGMAIPLALGGRLGRGEARNAVWRHVLARTAALLVLGVLMVNAERAAEGFVSAPLWNVLMTVAVVLVWSAPPANGPASRRHRILRLCGVLLLVAMVLLYRGEEVSGFLQLRPHWWGILGLIGWAYLVAASLYLLVGDRPAVLLGFVALLYCVYLADDAGQAAWLAALKPVVSVGRFLGAHGAVVLAGTVLAVMMLKHQREDRPLAQFVGPALGYAAGLAAAGILLHTLHALHPAFRINKILATAPWCLLSSAITAAAWVLAFVLADVKGLRRWPKAVEIAGENALVAYLMAPLLLSVFALIAPAFRDTNPYEALAAPAWLGFIRSAAFAWLVVRLCGWMRDHGLRMQL